MPKVVKSSSSSLPLIYCVKCRRKTGNISPHLTETKNNRKMVKCECADCGTTKCLFVK
jgi:hypothetical protein